MLLYKSIHDCLCRTSQAQELDEEHKRKKLVAMDRILILMEGTVTRRDGGGVEYTQNECANIIEHGLHAGVASMKTLGSQVENAFSQRALEVFSTTKTKGDVRAVAIPSYETYKDMQDGVGLLLNFQALSLVLKSQGQPLGK